MHDKYYLAMASPPPVEKPILIKESGNTYTRWDGKQFRGDATDLMMGDYDIHHLSMQEAEEHMRGIAPGV